MRISKRSVLNELMMEGGNDMGLDEEMKSKINEEFEKKKAYAGLNLGDVKKIKVQEMTHAEARREKARALRMHEVEEVHLSHLKEGGSGWRVQNFSSFAERDAFLKTGRTQAPKTPEKTETPETPKTPLDKDDEDDATLAPPLRIKPTLVSANVCVQVDLDLGTLSGGAFPGIFGVGLLGDIHKIPETQCYGWSNELYIQLSLYFPGLSSVFRITFVFVGTLRIQEQPLNVAAGDLTWEMPPGFDTSLCHTSSPFKLMWNSFKAGWKFIKTHVLTNQYLKNPEYILMEKLKESAEDLRAFDEYGKILKPKNKNWLWVMAPIDNTFNGGLVHEKGIGNVTIEGTWEGFKLHLTVHGGLRQEWDATVVELPSTKQVFIWQDMGAFVHTAESSTHASNETVMWHFTVRPGENVLAQVEFFNHVDNVEYLAPFVLDAESMVMNSSRKKKFSFNAHVRQKDEQRLPGKLAVTRLTAKVTGDKCSENQYGIHDVEVRVRSSKDGWDEAHWGKAEFGAVAPWGVDIRSQERRMARELYNLIPQNKSLTNIGKIPHDSIIKLLKHGVQEDERSHWKAKIESFTQKMQERLKEPSEKAFEILRTDIIENYIEAVIASVKSWYDEPAASAEAGDAELQETLKVIAQRVPVEIAQSINKAKLKYPEENAQAARIAMAKAGAMFEGRREEIIKKKYFERLPEDVRKADSPRTDSPPRTPKKSWVVFKAKTIRGSNCKKATKDLVTKTLDLCRLAASTHCKECNVVRFMPPGENDEDEKKEGVCTLWYCSSIDNTVLDKDPEFDLAAYLDADENPEKATPVEIVESVPAWALRHAIDDFGDKELRQALVSLSRLKAARSVWQEIVVKTSRSEGLSFNHIKTDWLRSELMKGLLYKEKYTSWMDKQKFSMLLGSLDELLTENMSAQVILRAGRYGEIEHLANLTLDGGDLRGRKWNERVGFKWQDKRKNECIALVEISWAWQPAVQPGYFLRPNLLPVVRAYFAAYDQYASKLPLYASQVMDRLKPKDDESWFASWGNILPYYETDGRFLHRHLKKGEQDKVKVHEGELGTDDAVFNIEKALNHSRHREEKDFQYNAGLSVANLFIRVVSDVQALFFIYFANHPDWDGRCTSLPARFRLFHEFNSKGGPYSSYRSNWGFEPDQYARKDSNPDGSANKLPKMRTGSKNTVADHGEIFDDEDSSLFLNWHWVSAPHRFGSEKKRAAFFSRTPPVHGKDGWATTNVKELNSVVWPHIWCELVQGYWVKDEREVVKQSIGSNDAKVLHTLKQLMLYFERDPIGNQEADISAPSDYSKEFKRAMLKAQEALKEEPMKCGEMEETFKEQKNASSKLIKNSEMVLEAGTRIADLYHQALDLLKNDIETAEGDADEKGSEKIVDGADSESGQISTLEETLEQLETSNNEEMTSIKGLANAIEEMWRATNEKDQKNQQARSVQARHKMEKMLNEVEVSLVEKERATKQIQEQIESLLQDYPRSETKEESRIELREQIEKEIIGDMRYAAPLLEALIRVQVRTVAEFRLMQSCILLNLRPDPLPPTRFWPWAVGKPGSERLSDLTEYMDGHSMSGTAANGIDLFFEDACRVPLNLTKLPIQDQAENTEEPRHECEKVTLHLPFFTIFPSFAERTLKLYQEFTKDLKKLREKPSIQSVKDLSEKLQTFVKTLQEGGLAEGFDEDFYTAFAYRSDGSLFGDLWATLGDVSTKIEANLEDRKADHKSWIVEGVMEQAALQRNRRMRVRQPKPPEVDIPALRDGCVCEPKWNVWYRGEPFWKKGMWPDTHEGCIAPEVYHPDNQTKLMGVDNDEIRNWPGICKGKQKLYDVECDGVGKIISCDPTMDADKRPPYGIWRKNDVDRKNLITLPLLRMDFFAHFDVRNFRADFCTPNFASLLIDVNLVWSTYSWIPYEKRFSRCPGLRVHPPGFYIYVTRCQHFEMGKVKTDVTQHVDHHEWQLVFVFYLNSYYNTFGTGDGDDLKSWFGMDQSGFGAGDNWANKIGARGINIFLQDTVWRTPIETNVTGPTEGFGYSMNVDEAVLGPSGIFLTIMAEMSATFVTGKAIAAMNKPGGEVPEDKDRKKGRFHMSKTMATTLLYGLAKAIWKILQGANVIPGAWDVGISVKGITKAVSKFGGKLEISPFRAEHDIILSMRASRSTLTIRKPQPAILQQIVYPQMENLFVKFEEAGLPMKTMWEEWLGRAGNDLQSASQLSRPIINHLLLLWKEERINTPLHWLFRGCNRPQWYKVGMTKEGVYAFYDTDLSAWVKPRQAPGKVVFLIRQDEDWFRDVTSEAREDRYYPQEYVKKKKLVFVAESDQSRASAQEGFRAINDKDLESLIYSAPLEALQCWAKRVIQEKGDVLGRAYEKENITVPIRAFRKDYARDFLKRTWTQLKGCAAARGHTRALGSDSWGWHSKGDEKCDFGDESLHKDSGKIYEKVLKVLDRREDSNYRMSRSSDNHLRFHTSNNFDCGLTIQFRIGASFFRIPGILQVQPYMQLQLSYDVRQIIQALYIRFVKGSAPSKLQLHRARKNKCRECVANQKAFCDRRQAAKSMLKTGFDETEMDKCMDIDLASMDNCKAFKWPLNTNEGKQASTIFSEYVCPCFDDYTGKEMRPIWITSKARCDELALPGRDDEKSRRTQKRNDWKLGFKTASRLRLGNSVSYPEKAGCRANFKCCTTDKLDGSQITRCVDVQYIKSVLGKAKCSYFKPQAPTTTTAAPSTTAEGTEARKNSDMLLKDNKWSHQRQWFRCNYRYESFDGHWTKVRNNWQNVESVEA